MPKKKPYFPNNWKAIKDTPAEAFSLPQGYLSFEEFMDWKVAGYELPSSVVCIIREKNLRTGKVKEHVYQKPSAAQDKINTIMSKAESELTVCHEDQIDHLYPKYMEEDDD